MWYHIEYKKKTCYSRFYSQMISCMHPYKSPFSFKSFHSFICIWKETNCMQIFLFCFSACSKSPLCIKIVNHILLGVLCSGYLFWIFIHFSFFICSYYKAVLLFYTYFCVCIMSEGYMIPEKKALKICTKIANVFIQVKLILNFFTARWKLCD